MELSFAPMEGITSCIYRVTYREYFPGADRYYSPFIAPDGKGNFRTAQLRDVLPENNPGIDLVPQILANSAEAFLTVAERMQELGYREVNLNVGCPSGTVVSKHKGSGMLADLRSLDDFLADVFSRCGIGVSVKTRMGMESTDEFPAILEIYNKYPIKELIIHARARSGMYKSMPDIVGFARATRAARMPVTYNGNLFALSDLERLRTAVPQVESYMQGRGAVANPALFRVLKGGSPVEKAELRDFTDTLAARFSFSGLSDNFVLSRMKELWFYMIWLFPDSHRQYKAINKAQHLSDYASAVSALFSECPFDPEGRFEG